jgi:hypothetical protein
VDDAHRVSELQAVEQLSEPFGRSGRRNHSGALQLRAPGLAGHEFHDQVRASGTDGTVVVHARDGWVIDLRGGPRLALEAPERGGIAEERFHHHRGRHLASQSQVGCFEDGAETAAPQRALEAILAIERPLDRQRQRELRAVPFAAVGPRSRRRTGDIP